jgi:hypothetical protein
MASGAHLNLASFDKFGLSNSVKSDIVFHTNFSSQKIHLASGSNVSAKLTVTSNNIGINNINPAYSLEVTGDTYSTTIKTPSLTSSSIFIGNSNNIFNNFSSTTPNLSSINYNYGNVGIGTTNPKYLMDINGITNISSNLYVLSNIGIGITNPTGKLHLYGSNNYLKIQDSYSTSNITTILEFSNKSSSQYGYIGYSNSSTDLIINNIESGNLLLYNNNSEKIRINSSGNVGIGTTNPNSLLYVNGTITNMGSITSTGPIWINSTSADGGNIYGGIGMLGANNRDWGIYVANSGTTKSFNGGTAVSYGGVSSTTIRFRTGNGDNFGFIWENMIETGLMSLSGNNGNLTVKGSITAGSTLTVSGNVGIGITNPSFNLDINGNARVYSASPTILRIQEGAGSYASSTLEYYNNSSLLASIGYAGGADFIIKNVIGNSTITLLAGTGATVGPRVTNNSATWGSSSDIRLKKNIIDLDYGINDLLKIKPVRFNFKVDKDDNSNRLGFIAQDILEIIPEIIVKDFENYYLIGSTDLIPVIINSIKEFYFNNENENKLIKEELFLLKTKIINLENDKILMQEQINNLDSKLENIYTKLNLV